MKHQHWISAIFLWIYAVNIGTFAYVFPPDLINHEPVPDPFTESTSILCEPEGVYTKIDPVFCDRFVNCTYGQPNQFECPDGYGFQPFQGCQLIHQVDCGSRSQLQPPKGSGVCPRLNGIYSDQGGCDRYIRCTNGRPLTESCNGQFIFDNKTKACRNPTTEEYSTCFLQDPQPTNYNPFSNQQIPTTQSLPNQQQSTTYSTFPDQQVLSNFNSFSNQQVPTTSNPANLLIQTTNQPKPSASINQQIPVPTNYNSFINQQVPTTYPPSMNQQIPTPYNPSLSNQQVPVLTTYNPPVNQRPTPYTPSLSSQLVPTVYNPHTTPHQGSQYGQTPQYAPHLSEATAPIINFVCPPTNYLEFGDHNRYQYPGNCHRFYICLRDGSAKLGGCQAPMAYDTKNKVCVPMESVPNCR